MAILYPNAGRRSRRGRSKTDDRDQAVQQVASDLEKLRLANPHLGDKLAWTREVLFAQRIGRQWRSDFANLHYDILLEVEGGTWLPPSIKIAKDGTAKAVAGGGRHNRGAGYEEDCIKYSMASILGHTLIRVTTSQVKRDVHLELVRAALREKGANLKQ